MNEKIKQLAEQSYEAATITTIDPFTQEVVTDYIDGTKLIFNKEKFAELLFNDIAMFSMVITDDHYDVDSLYRHYGVEL